jgi:hypothetical protein
MWFGLSREGSGVQRSMMRDLSRWMCLDQAAAAQAALRVVGGRVRDQLRLDCRDFPFGEADIDGAAVGRSGHARVADHVVEHE